MKFDITQAKIEYTHQITQLTEELGYQVQADETHKWLEELLASPSHYVFVAVSEEQVCGWLVVEKRVFLESGYKVEITGLVVGKAFRRHGIAQALVNAAQEWAIRHGAAQLVVRSNTLRKESHEFYPAMDFILSKTSHVYTKQLNYSGA